MSDQHLTVGIAQIAPAWLQRDATIEKVVNWIEKAAADNCKLVAFGEALIPGYPSWVSQTDGARFEDQLQKSLYAHYVSQSVCIEDGDLDRVVRAARDNRISVYVGIMERARNRGGHTVYASMVYINADGEIGSVHRKLMPTYEERLVWGTGDGHGLRTHPLGAFTVGGLNCWENWLPLARSALYAQGEDLHVAIWPGNLRNTEDVTRFIALESRSYVVSACALLTPDAISEDLPHADVLLEAADGMINNGGSCVASPNGDWILEPQADKESLFVVTLDHATVLEERQNLDVSGHYSRPDVTRLVVNRERQATAEFED